MKRVIKVHIISHYLLVITLAIFVPFAALAGSGEEIADRGLIHTKKNYTKKNHKQIIEVSYQKQLFLNVADEAINRINFKHARVSKIIGNVSGFSSILSDDGSNLFITPKASGSNIDFAVLLSSGDIIDMSLHVVKSKKPYLISLHFPDSNNNNIKSEASSLIEAMKNQVIGKYYVQKSSSNVTIPGKDKLKATSSDIYRFGNLHGTILILQNMNKKTRKNTQDSSIEITEDNLIRAFGEVVGVYIEKRYLSPSEKTKAYIVFKEVI